MNPEFDSLSRENKKDYLVNLCKNFILINKCIPKIENFEKLNIWYKDIRKVFGGFTELLRVSGATSKARSQNLSDCEMMDYLKSIKVVDCNYDSNPSHRGINSICREKCGCWITNKCYTDPIRGTTKIHYKGKTWYLHRLSYFLFNGNISEGMVVSHKCDNSACFNPEHLEVGTQQENMQDCINRTRRIYDANKSAATRKDRGDLDLTDPYDYEKLLLLVSGRIDITTRDEWLYNKGLSREGYPEISIYGKKYKLHRLILANKLGKKYEEIDIARHILPDGSNHRKTMLILIICLKDLDPKIPQIP